EEDIRDSDSLVEAHRAVSWRVVHAPSNDAIHTCGYSETSNSDGSSRYGTRAIRFSDDHLAVLVTEDDGRITRIPLEWPAPPMEPPEDMVLSPALQALRRKSQQEYEQKKANRERIEAEWRAKRT